MANSHDSETTLTASTCSKGSSGSPQVVTVGEWALSRPPSTSALRDSLSRNVYCVLGMPIDIIDMASVVQTIEAAAEQSIPYLISTPNLNFLVTSLSHSEFRNALLLSDLCPADGAPIIWIGRLLGLPIRTRIAGSDIFEELKRPRDRRPLKVFLFGGAEGIAAAAAEALNTPQVSGLVCAGYLNPGFGSVEDLSSPEIIRAVNSSNADFLAVALGATNGQAWLIKNHDRLRIPVRSHLGATINFQAGVVKRAPLILRKLGLEWLWRIKEEPQLWRRYWNDGQVLLRLLTTRVLPLGVCNRLSKLAPQRYHLSIASTIDGSTVTLRLSGVAIDRHIDVAIARLRHALSVEPAVLTLDLSGTLYIDARFFGLLMILRQELVRRGAKLQFTSLSRSMKRWFRLNEASFLIGDGGGGSCRLCP